MKLDWDEQKRERTLLERGLDFADIDLLDWSTAIIADDVRFEYGEPRKVAYGFLRNRLLVVCFVHRDGMVRVISMRKANNRERDFYERNIGK